MRTSEITALSQILGAVATVQAQSELALSFDVVKQRVRDEFDMWVLELECIDLFDLVVIIGGTNAGFIDDLVDFAC
jgi:hypothetical protein